MAARMTARQGMVFFAFSAIKTVDDHCGYALPWDPLQHITSNNAGYHDIHHQSWGIKTNFSQPFFTFWDRFLGTMWTGGDVSTRYARDRANAERLLKKDNAAKVPSDEKKPDPISHSSAQQSLTEDIAPYEDEAANAKLMTSDIQEAVLPSVPDGKASAQAIGSREQVLEDQEGGGPSVLADEAEEEIEALEKASRRSGRSSRRSTGGSLKGLRERVDGKLRGRARDVMKVESS
jgi:sphinganine C4-monooxygenase